MRVLPKVRGRVVKRDHADLTWTKRDPARCYQPNRCVGAECDSTVGLTSLSISETIRSLNVSRGLWERWSTQISFFAAPSQVHTR
jgi:hypothetical protein